MAANDSEKAKLRVMDLITKLLEYIRDGKRDANDVSRVLQAVKDDPNFIQQLFPETSASQLIERPRRLKAMLRDWERFYQDVFGLQKNFSGLKVPSKQPGFDRLLVVAKGMTPSRIYSRMKELMPAWKYWDNLDSITSDRKADQDYAIWVRDRVEADEELKNKSANQLKQEGIQGITLEEYLLFVLKYFKETLQGGQAGKHLDIDSWTLCAGSRGSGGRVPRVHWDLLYREVHVSWYSPQDATPFLRARVAVS